MRREKLSFFCRRRAAPFSRCGQTALEFVVLLGFMLFIFTAFFYAMQERSAIVAVQQHTRELHAVSEILLQEVTTAHRVREGYSREFALPLTLSSGNYTIQLVSSSELIISTTDQEYIIFLPTNISTDTGAGPQSSGRIYPPLVLITKQDSSITLKSTP